MNTLGPQSGEQSLCLVVPVFNEEVRAAESIDEMIDYIARKPPGSRLVYVDDGSSDRTVEVVTGAIERRGFAGMVVIMECPHAGKGAALRAGLSDAGTDVAAFCDVDLATPLGELDRVIEAAIGGDCLAIGSRATPDAKIDAHESRRREIAGKAYNLLVRLAACPGVADTQCGAKAAPVAAWDRILQHSCEAGFAWDVEVIAVALRLGIPVRELGVHWVHDDRTRVRVLRDGLAMAVAVFRIRSNIRKLRYDSVSQVV